MRTRALHRPHPEPRPELPDRDAQARDKDADADQMDDRHRQQYYGHDQAETDRAERLEALAPVDEAPTVACPAVVGPPDQACSTTGSTSPHRPSSLPIISFPGVPLSTPVRSLSLSVCLMLGAGPAIAQDITAMSLPDSVTTSTPGDWRLLQDKVRWAVAPGLETIPAGDAIAQMGGEAESAPSLVRALWRLPVPNTSSSTCMSSTASPSWKPCSP